MKKILLTLAAAVLAAAPFADAATLTPAQALARLNGAGGESTARKAPSSLAAATRLVATELMPSSQAPAVYLFAGKDNKGFVLVSADDTAEALLGYSTTATVADRAEMAPALQWWLEEYARQIEWQAAHADALPTKYVPASRAERTAVAPLITTQWDQGEPYNVQCPKYGDVETWTGCVATAMAQVMKYWEYPEKGSGKITYDSEDIQKRLSLDFSLRKFDWANMKQSYFDGTATDEEIAAVAYLMKAAGYSVKMQYGIDASAALAMYIRRALVKYFNYDGNTKYTLRQYYTTSEWEQLIYDEVAANRPVLIGGGSMIGGGHSFICDGYDGQGLFHFNWGWTGMSDGYFSFDALNPYSLGAGGGEGGGYNFTQDAVIGIQPPTGDPVVEQKELLTQTGSLYAEVNDEGLLAFDLFCEEEAMWVNYNPSTLNVMLGAKFEPLDGTPGDVFVAEVTDKRFKLEPGYATGPTYFTPYVDLSKYDLADGKYKVTIVQADPEADTPLWEEVLANRFYYNYCTLTKGDGTYAVEYGDVYRLDIVTAKVKGDMYYGMCIEVEIKVKNESDHEISSGFAPVFYYGGSLVMMGESIMLTVPGNTTVTKSWVTPVYTLSQYFSPSKDIDVVLSFFDEATYNIYSHDIWKGVVLKANPGLADIVTTSNPSIQNAETKVERVNGQRVFVYQVTDPHTIMVDCDVMLNEGYFYYPLYACVVAPSSSVDGYLEMLTYAGEPTLITEPGEKAHVTANVAFPSATLDSYYYLMMGYAYGSNFVQIGPGMSVFKIVSAAGVDNVATDNDTLRFDGISVIADGYDIEIFTLQGIKVAEAADILPVAALNKGIYIARAGNATLKFSVK